MSKKQKYNKNYLHFLKIILERELKEKDINEVDLDLCRTYAKSIADFLDLEKETYCTHSKLLLERNYGIQL